MGENVQGRVLNTARLTSEGQMWFHHPGSKVGVGIQVVHLMGSSPTGPHSMHCRGLGLLLQSIVPL